MLIGLISDTHIATQRETLPVQVTRAFQDVDLILHAGDIWIPAVLDELESVAPVRAAWGDDDLREDFANDKRMLDGHVLAIEGVKLWVSHVRPPYSRINPEDWAYVPRFKRSHDTGDGRKDRPDVVIYGHSHSAAVEPYKDVLLVNPGSATVPEYVPKLGTVGFLNIDRGKVSARILQLE